ncbi:hypothetical protein [Fundidesulfovibrio soli]|uniref:hypothetical protein n=1 Tax=Fundidesulfovibrio soli TaxID=2922716 RepID=UPI001FAF7199|nr:hypothetical protein [Fundidesulfovibrio soli]
MQRRCANCSNWDTRDSLVGFCQEITEHLRLDAALLVHGLATCRTSATGWCLRFGLSGEARAESEAESRHQRELRGAAGQDFPASLRR